MLSLNTIELSGMASGLQMSAQGRSQATVYDLALTFPQEKQKTELRQDMFIRNPYQSLAAKE